MSFVIIAYLVVLGIATLVSVTSLFSDKVFIPEVGMATGAIMIIGGTTLPLVMQQ